MTTQEALKKTEQLAQERKRMLEAGIARIEELIDKYGTTNVEPLEIRCARQKVIAVSYGDWKPAYISSEPYRKHYLIVLEPDPGAYIKRCSKWPLHGNVTTPSDAWRIVEAIEKAVQK